MGNKIEEISDKVYYNMKKYSQLIIDLVEDIEDIMEFDELNKIEQLGAKSYEISGILEIINPKLQDDIKILNELLEIIKQQDK